MIKWQDSMGNKCCYFDGSEIEAPRYKRIKKIKETESVKNLKTLQEGNIIVLSGSVGCGKTIAVLNFLSQSGGSGYITAIELYNACKLNAIMVINEAKNTSILALDDLGSEYEAESGYFQSIIDEIIDYRYLHLKTTIVTTNLNLEQFVERYGKRFVGRIKEWGRFIESDEKSQRKKGE